MAICGINFFNYKFYFGLTVITFMWCQMGKLKKRIRPSDITINIGKDAPIPECPIPGERFCSSWSPYKEKKKKGHEELLRTRCSSTKTLSFYTTNMIIFMYVCICMHPFIHQCMYVFWKCMGYRGKIYFVLRTYTDTKRLQK